MMMVPEPWSKHESMDDEKKAFYEYHSTLDGAVGWTGCDWLSQTAVQIGAILDRNGLASSSLLCNEG